MEEHTICAHYRCVKTNNASMYIHVLQSSEYKMLREFYDKIPLDHLTSLTELTLDHKVYKYNRHSRELHVILYNYVVCYRMHNHLWDQVFEYNRKAFDWWEELNKMLEEEF